MIDLDLTIPDSVLDAAGALRQDTFYIVRAQSSTVSGITTPATPTRIGPFLGEFWNVSGDELAPAIAEARGLFRLATALTLDDPDTGDSVTIALADQIEVAGAAYEVCWNPDPSGLDITRIIGLKQ